MAISLATVAASRTMSHSKTSLRNLIRHHLIPAAGPKVTSFATADVQLINNSPGSLLSLSEPRPFCIPDSIENRSTRLIASIQFPLGLAAEHILSQPRIEVHGRPIKIDDDFSDYGDSDDDDDDDDNDDDDDGTYEYRFDVDSKEDDDFDDVEI